MKNKSVSLISSAIFVIVGFTIFFHPELVVKFISYFVGGLLIAVGLYKSVNYYIKDKNLGVVNRNELEFGVTAVILGILFICLAGTIEFLLRFIVGAFLIMAGIGKILKTFYTTNRDAKFYALLVIGFLYIGAGMYIIFVSNIAIGIIGLFMAIYGISNIITTFVYKDYDKNNKKIEVKEAEVIETKEEK
jgi:uncharacterized membrane protein HdeD (DUF308 family)